jgi:hypothetical protein
LCLFLCFNLWAVLAFVCVSLLFSWMWFYCLKVSILFARKCKNGYFVMLSVMNVCFHYVMYLKYVLGFI